MDESVLKAASQVRLLITDVDGVMTDGGIIIDNQGNELKCFHVRDGHGIKLLLRAGIGVVIVTGRESEAVSRRAAELGIIEVYQGVKVKMKTYERVIKEHRLKDEQMAYIGDDIVDVPVLRRVGFSVAVADAEDYVKDAAIMVTKRGGGRGAVREVADLLLRAGGYWDAVTGRYF